MRPLWVVRNSPEGFDGPFNHAPVQNRHEVEQVLPAHSHGIIEQGNGRVPSGAKVQEGALEKLVGMRLASQRIEVEQSYLQLLSDAGRDGIKGFRHMFLRVPVQRCAAGQSRQNLESSHLRAPVHPEANLTGKPKTLPRNHSGKRRSGKGFSSLHSLKGRWIRESFLKDRIGFGCDRVWTQAAFKRLVRGLRSARPCLEQWD